MEEEDDEEYQFSLQKGKSNSENNLNAISSSYKNRIEKDDFINDNFDDDDDDDFDDDMESSNSNGNQKSNLRNVDNSHNYNSSSYKKNSVGEKEHKF